MGSDLLLPPPLADVEGELPFSLSGFSFAFLLNLGLLDVARPSNSGMFAFSAASLMKSANLTKVG